MPEEQKVTRKLSAFLSADVKGSILLMADDALRAVQRGLAGYIFPPQFDSRNKK